jgi:Zn-dependent peptidase ImmA (M78 family)
MSPGIREGTSPEARAQALLGEHGLAKVPIPIEKLAIDLGADVRRHAFEDDTSGMLIRDAGRVIIAVNSTHSESRQRFTIAHEIGHWILHRGRSLVVDATVKVNLRAKNSGFASQREETEANQFAAALLMPTVSVQSLYEKTSSGLTLNEIVGFMSARFKVSTDAMQYRLTNLGLVMPE